MNAALFCPCNEGHGARVWSASAYVVYVCIRIKLYRYSAISSVHGTRLLQYYPTVRHKRRICLFVSPVFFATGSGLEFHSGADGSRKANTMPIQFPHFLVVLHLHFFYVCFLLKALRWWTVLPMEGEMRLYIAMYKQQVGSSHPCCMASLQLFNFARRFVYRNSYTTEVKCGLQVVCQVVLAQFVIQSSSHHQWSKNSPRKAFRFWCYHSVSTNDDWTAEIALQAGLDLQSQDILP